MSHLHGRAKGNGAPCSERNGNYRDGYQTQEAIAVRRAVRALARFLMAQALRI